MSAGGDTTWVDRAPKQSPAMKKAYAGLADAERYVAECHRDEAWDEHHGAIQFMVEWHAEIGRIAQEEKR
jgi:hypothetical protein